MPEHHQIISELIPARRIIVEHRRHQADTQQAGEDTAQSKKFKIITIKTETAKPGKSPDDQAYPDDCGDTEKGKFNHRAHVSFIRKRRAVASDRTKKK